RKRADGTMLTPEEKFGYIRMAAVRHDRSAEIGSRTSAQYRGRIFTCLTEEKRPGPRTCQSYSSRDIKTGRGRDHERSLLSRLALQSSHGEKA
ncbi:hypothetical protein Tco_0430050, partial [Tanacetum coccineum]